MKWFTLPVCLLLAASTVAADAPKRPDLRPGEKVVLACLGMIATGDAAKAKRADAILALQREEDMLRPLATALTCRPARLRAEAARRLAALDDERAVRPLLHRVVRETDRTARAALVAALREIGDPSAVHVLGRALFSRDPATVRGAAAALAGLGDVLALPYVIQKWEGRSGDFPQVYFTQVSQRSYIQDFDVEVASTSFIADPIVGIIQEGMVQPVKIVATEQVEVSMFHATLKAVAGQDLGRKVGAWKRWWAENGERLQEERARRLNP
jgi:HEAT repeat protein